MKNRGTACVHIKIPESNEHPTETYPTCFTMMPSEIQAGSPRELDRPRANTKSRAHKKSQNVFWDQPPQAPILCMHTVNTYL